MALPQRPTRAVQIVYNPPGDDVAGEQVSLRNAGTDTVALAGWTLRDAGVTPNTYTFPAFSLAAGATVTVWVKAGTDTATEMYWAAMRGWNNDGDEVVLRDGGGRGGRVRMRAVEAAVWG